jgi:hypothetical protein
MTAGAGTVAGAEHPTASIAIMVRMPATILGLARRSRAIAVAVCVVAGADRGVRGRPEWRRGRRGCAAMPIRLDPVVTATYVVTLCAPVAAYASIRLARLRSYDRHRLIQGVLVMMCWLAVLGLELRIRLAGGSGAFVERAAPELIDWARRLLAVHITIAVATYALWTWLAMASWRRYEDSLPGQFSRRHRRLGTLVFGGLCFTAASASGMFALAFVL